MKETIKTIVKIGKAVMVLTSEVYTDGEVSDTTVTINDDECCVIAGADKQQFIDDITNLIGLYQI